MLLKTRTLYTAKLVRDLISDSRGGPRDQKTFENFLSLESIQRGTPWRYYDDYQENYTMVIKNWVANAEFRLKEKLGRRSYHCCKLQ